MRLTSLCTVAIGGVFAATAAMAATQVNIADPTVTSRAAKVDVGNRLAVQEVAPATFYHNGVTGLNSASGCVTIAAPPAGKALVVKQIRIDVGAVSPGPSDILVVYLGGACSNPAIVGSVHPGMLGLVTNTFDPGLTVPNGSVLRVTLGDQLQAEVYVDGYKVDSSVVPEAGGQTIEVSGTARR